MNMERGTETSVEAQGSAVRSYYGEILQSSRDLRTTACCSIDTMPGHLRTILAQLHPEVRDRFYGCGSPLPPALQGMTVLDLGSGSGRDAFLLSSLVGESGRVIGVDMTAQQLEVAQRHREFHAHAFGHAQSNVSFHLGDLADLAFAEIFRVLKPGGELYFSDVYSDRRLPRELLADPVLLGECLAGALYVEDFRRLMGELGVADARVCARSPIELTDAAIEQKIGFARFESITWRAFKLPLEDRCEDYGQVATYLGGLPDHPHRFVLDDHHLFERGKPLRVCGNTADMLGGSRYAAHFRIDGDKQHHYGLFDCSPNIPASSSASCC